MQRSPSLGDAVPSPAPETPTTVIRAFRYRHALSVDQLAALLGLEPAVVGAYERVGGAPPWVGYALVGLEYEVSGGEQDTPHARADAGAHTAAPQALVPSFPPRAAGAPPPVAADAV